MKFSMSFLNVWRLDSTEKHHPPFKTESSPSFFLSSKVVPTKKGASGAKREGQNSISFLALHRSSPPLACFFFPASRKKTLATIPTQNRCDESTSLCFSLRSEAYQPFSSVAKIEVSLKWAQREFCSIGALTI